MMMADQHAELSRDRPRWQVEIDAPAKINLFLEILGKRDDGFHELETVMVAVSLFDRLQVIRRDDAQIQLTVVCPPNSIDLEDQFIPTDERNLIVKALMRLRECAGVESSVGCDVVLYKRIPAAAGLGGASSDAAAALIAGCRLWDLNFSEAQLNEIAAGLGSDVPFFLIGGMAVCRGRGELIETVPTRSGIPVVIAMPRTGLSTPVVFRSVVPPLKPIPKTALVQSVETGSPQLIARSLFNRLQSFAKELNFEIGRLASSFDGINCLGHQMSGSGTSYFGIFSSHRVARVAAQTLSARLPDVRIFCTETISRRSAIRHHLNISA